MRCANIEGEYAHSSNKQNKFSFQFSASIHLFPAILGDTASCLVTICLRFSLFSPMACIDTILRNVYVSFRIIAFSHMQAGCHTGSACSRYVMLFFPFILRGVSSFRLSRDFYIYKVRVPYLVNPLLVIVEFSKVMVILKLL